ncbi:hypothetical protein B566_EDAN005537 [Ephemera danica]|nr:hypothetical protein B566_EDAN005537 [Ephemera danica]
MLLFTLEIITVKREHLDRHSKYATAASSSSTTARDTWGGTCRGDAKFMPPDNLMLGTIVTDPAGDGKQLLHRCSAETSWKQPVVGSMSPPAV